MSAINVASDFSPYLGGRYRDDGPWSGEEFRDELLRPSVAKALETGAVVEVNFDGVAGMPPSFLEEAFGGLLRAMADVDPTRLQDVVKLDAKDPELWPFLRLATEFMKRQAARQH